MNTKSRENFNISRNQKTEKSYPYSKQILKQDPINTYNGLVSIYTHQLMDDGYEVDSKKCDCLYTRHNFFRYGLGVFLRGTLQISASATLAIHLASILGKRRGTCTCHRHSKLLQRYGNYSTSNNNPSLVVPWKSRSNKSFDAASKEALQGYEIRGFIEAINKIEYLQQIDTAGFRSAMLVLELLTKGINWDFSKRTEFENDKLVILYLDQLVEYVMMRFETSPYQLYFVRLASNAIISASCLQQFLDGSCITLDDVSLVLVKSLYLIVKKVLPCNSRFINVPFRLCSIFYHRFDKSIESTLEGLAGTESYSMAVTQKALQMWIPGVPALQTPYLHRIVEYSCENKIVRREDNKLKWIHEFELIPSSTTNITQLLFPAVSPNFTFDTNKQYFYLQDVALKLLPTLEKFKLFRFLSYQKMMFAFHSGRSTERLSRFLRKKRILKQLHNASFNVQSVTFVPALRNEWSAPNQEGYKDTKKDDPFNLDSTFKALETQMLALYSTPFHNPLRVKFRSELGQDAGGVQIEFFKHFAQGLFKISDKSKYKLFTVIKESHKMWLDPELCDAFGNTFNKYEAYFYVGIIIGLALFNSNTVAVNFPRYFYKSLIMWADYESYEKMFDSLSETEKRTAVAELWPTYSKTMDYYSSNKQELESAYIPFEIPNEKQLIAKMPSNLQKQIREKTTSGFLTKDNIQLFIECFILCHLKYNISQFFDCICQGFYTIVDRSMVRVLLDPDELRLLVQGIPFTDPMILYHCATYGPQDTDGGSSALIQNFWQIVLYELSQAQVSQLVQFVTGTDHLPPSQKIEFVISRNGRPDVNSLPTASVCTSTLFLPEYPNKGILKEKLVLALEFSQGFGLY